MARPSDTYIDGLGNYTVNGGGGEDHFQINQNSNEVVFAFTPSNQLAVSTYDSTTLTAANLTGTTTLIGFNRINLNDESVRESTSVGGGVQLNLQIGSTLGGTVNGFASDDAVAFARVAYALGDHAVFTSNGAGGGTVSVENSGGTKIASFNVEGNYQSSQFGVSGGAGGALVVSGPVWQQSPNPLANFGWAQGWGSPNNPRELVQTATDPSGGADYVGFGASSVVIALGESMANGPTFTTAIAAVHNFGSAEGYTTAAQRGAADTGDSIAPTVYAQGFKGVYWYTATGGTATTPTYQSTANLYPNFGSQQGWTTANGFDVVKADSTDAFASILGFGGAGIVVGPQAFDPSTASSPNAPYAIPFAAGNNSGWSQTTDIRSFLDNNGQAIDLNGDGVTDFVGMGPQGLEFAFGSDTRRPLFAWIFAVGADQRNQFRLRRRPRMERFQHDSRHRQGYDDRLLRHRRLWRRRRLRLDGSGPVDAWRPGVRAGVSRPEQFRLEPGLVECVDAEACRRRQRRRGP
jgi:hypothetical protein